jgi:serine/threonine-protein kinase
MSDVGRTLGGRYQLGDVIGHGGMAEVHAGTDLRLGRQVAIKVLRPELARDPAFLARFRREAQSAAGLNHPNIVAVYDTGEDEFHHGMTSVTVPWIVMERVEGVTLRQVLASGKKIAPERALDVVNGVLAALDYSHRHGIVHRDIKPANIMITQSGDVKVMDFGIARALADASATMTHTNAVMGTAQYLSPEQAKGETVDARSDIYSTGCLLYELLTSRPPFVGDSPVSVAFQHVSEKPVPPSHLNAEIPFGYDAVVMRSLQKAPADRYPTAADMRLDVERVLAGMSVATPLVHEDEDFDSTRKIPVITKGKTDVMAQPKKPQTKTLVAAGAGVAALILASLFLIIFLLKPAPVEQVQVPNLAGMTIPEATTALNNVGLVLGQQTPEENPDYPVNTIISQNPTTGSSVDRGSAINIVISKGKNQVPVPTLVNFTSLDDVRAALNNVNLILGAVDYEDSDLPTGTVLRSDPVAGVYVDAGTAINIVVSSGKLTVPSVVGMSEDVARALLTDAGFVVTDSIYQTDDTVSPGTVLSQNPVADTKADSGSSVTLTVSTLTPDPTES